MSYDRFAYWEEYLQKARNGHDRPIGGSKNTRVHWRGADAICIQYHSTDIVTFYRDGRISLANGGWNTITTTQKIRQHSPARLSSWTLPFADDPDDPEPEHLERHIPKPYAVPDPGPEPEDDGVGCRAGEREEYECQEDKALYDWEEGKPGIGFPIRKWYEDGSGGKLGLRLTSMHRIAYVAEPHEAYGWAPDKEPNTEYKVCPHCAKFKTIHEDWSRRMNGGVVHVHQNPDGSWLWRSRRIEVKSYTTMCEMLATYQTREEWQVAYIEEFREVRANQRERKAWDERNHIDFHNGIEIDPLGRVPLKFKRAHLKKLKQTKRIEAKHKRERAREVAKIEQERAAKKMARLEIAQGLAGSLVNELELCGREWVVNGWEAVKV